MNTSAPFDDYPYHAFPITRTAPERLSVASRVHGGPRTRLAGARVLEFGCANGANLLPLAWYRRDSEFVGVDGSRRQVDAAETARERLGLDNLRFVHAEFTALPADLGGPFDYVIAHGVLSWIPDAVRDALLVQCAQLLAADGLVYLNYNTRPGWTVRGMVRDFLLRHTEGAGDLRARGERCRELAAAVIGPLRADEHPYTQLMANEFRLVTTQHPAYLAHEYLAPYNVAYWRSEMLALCAAAGLDYVADADFNSPGHRITGELQRLLENENLSDSAVDDSLDLLLYRQMHSPVMTHAGFQRRAPDPAEFAALRLAAPLQRVDDGAGAQGAFRHPDGHELEVSDPELRAALCELGRRWPESRPLSELFRQPENVREDLEYLFRGDLVELRCVEPAEWGVDPAPLHALEAELRGHVTSPHHELVPVAPRPGA